MRFAAEVADLFRQRPEYWFIATVALAALTSFTNIGQAVLGPAVLRRLTFVTPDPILPFTLGAAAVAVISVAAALKKWGRLDTLRTIVVAASVPIGAVGAFEIPFQLIRAQAYPAVAGGPVDYHPYLALSIWVLVGFTSVGYWKLTSRFFALLVGTFVGFLLWWSVGYPQVTSGVTAQVELGYLFNVPLKFAAFAIFALPILEWARARHSTRVATSPESEPNQTVAPDSLLSSFESDHTIR
jgi:hypothetical protein